MKQEQLIAEFNLSECMNQGYIYIDMFAMKEPKHFIDRMVRWYLIKYHVRASVISLTTKELNYETTY